MISSSKIIFYQLNVSTPGFGNTLALTTKPCYHSFLVYASIIKYWRIELVKTFTHEEEKLESLIALDFSDF